MAPFSIQFQRSHDIDWFARINNTYIHALSFGGLLPKEVNNREVNYNILRHVYRFEPENEIKIVVNDAYVDRRIRPQARENDITDFERRKERYLLHFRELAKRGFWSFDRDLNDEKVYHLIAKPEGKIDKEWYESRVPVLGEKASIRENDNDVTLVLE